MLSRWPTTSLLMMTTLIPTRRTRMRTLILMMSRGVNKVSFDVSHVAFDAKWVLICEVLFKVCVYYIVELCIN
jgi:hypothetical protein